MTRPLWILLALLIIRTNKIKISFRNNPTEVANNLVFPMSNILARTALRNAVRTVPRRARCLTQAVTESESPAFKAYLAEDRALASHAARK